MCCCPNIDENYNGKVKKTLQNLAQQPIAKSYTCKYSYGNHEQYKEHKSMDGLILDDNVL